MKKLNTRHYAYIPVALACLVTLAGCSSAEHQDLRDFIAREKARPPGRIEPLPEFEMYETFTYQARDDRDPFRPEEEAILTQGPKVASGPRPDGNRNKEALEDFPLDSLTFMGLLQKEGVTWGIVKSPDGMVHRTQVGNHMGQNYGKITAINESKIELMEIVPDGRGGWFEREAAVAISD
jgi:type IV pilus assembly protein PilP